MKKRMIAFLVVVLVLTCSTGTAYAATSTYPAYAVTSTYRGAKTVVYETDYEAMRQAIIADLDEEEYLEYKEDIENGIRIQILFDKQGRLNLDRLMKETHLRETETDEEVIAAGIEKIREEYRKMNEVYDEELAKLGVVKVEPSNPEHRAMLTSMQNGMVLEANGFSGLSDGSTSGFTPDFNLITLGILGLAILISLCRREGRNPAFKESRQAVKSQY